VSLFAALVIVYAPYRRVDNVFSYKKSSFFGPFLVLLLKRLLTL
jgi:hypothetical protein